ncbi:hypothetical protein CerSpe_003470 [Prunus speciosa]
MEKNRLSNNLKDHGIVTRAIRDSNNKRIIHCSQSCEEDYINGFSWPPRSYTCSFCKREFRSAQALGGHMNVHRKDRARLKNSPPIDGQYTSTIFNLNLKPNPNPNFLSTSSPSSSSSLVSPFSSSLSLPSLISPPLPPPPPPPIFSVPSSENMKWVVGGTLFNHPLNLKASDLSTKLKGAKSLCGVGQEDQEGCIKTLKKAADPHQILRLDLEIGMFGDTNKEDLDLELRLGYS